MKKIVFALLGTVSGLVLLFSYRTSLGEGVSEAASSGGGAGSGASTGTTSSGGSSSTGSSSSGSSSAGSSSSGSSSAGSSSAGSPSSSASSSSSSSGLKNGTYTGEAAQTRFGAVQVKIVVSGGKITSVTVPAYPSENGRDVEIANESLPQLISETLSAQSAHIDMVSGATYTSEGYLQSLQSAIDAARA